MALTHPAANAARETATSTEATRPPALWRRAIALVLKAVLPFGLIYLAVWAASQIFATAPDAARSPPPRSARLVEVITAAPATEPPVIVAWGQAEAMREAVIRPEVTGRVLAVHPELTPGGRLAAGDEMLRLDDTDYRLTLERARADVAKVEADIALERGNQAVARREYELLGRRLRPEEEALVLRQPQLARLEADLAGARAAVAAAELNVARAVIRAPFDAIVTSESVAVGSAIGTGTEVATLVASERFHVMVAIPPAALEWIEFPDEGHEGTLVRLRDDAGWPEGVWRTGRVVRLSASLTETGRMTEVVVALDDPLALAAPETPPVLLGAFLRAEIAGRPVEGALAIDRAALRDGDTVWVMTPEGTLEIRAVTVAWRGPERVLVTGGLAAGEQVVLTQLATVAEGMALRTREATP